MRHLSCAVLCMVFAFGPASAETFGKWYADVDRSGEYAFALSINDSGHVLGQWCYPDSGLCVWLIALKTSCTSGRKHPVLANSDKGAAHLTVLCDGQLANGMYRYAFTDFDEIDNVIRSATRVGFALPLEDDAFRVVRFDLKGARQALSALREAAGRAARPAGRGTRGERL